MLLVACLTAVSKTGVILKSVVHFGSPSDSFSPSSYEQLCYSSSKANANMNLCANNTVLEDFCIFPLK